jgi:hypothetical protein
MQSRQAEFFATYLMNRFLCSLGSDRYKGWGFKSGNISGNEDEADDVRIELTGDVLKVKEMTLLLNE